MRGKEVGKHVLLRSGRITPAHAGKSHSSRLLPSVLPDHPRACGEKGSFIVLSEGMIGSPPRMRGKARLQGKQESKEGITPAHAGKSGRAYCKIYNEWGSPPRMRGKASVFHPFSLGLGITPAHAGKSSFKIIHYIPIWDHPRACGEKVCVDFAVVYWLGSPPRMRGKAGHRPP